jgi:hypothetical protein
MELQSVSVTSSTRVLYSMRRELTTNQVRPRSTLGNRTKIE